MCITELCAITVLMHLKIYRIHIFNNQYKDIFPVYYQYQDSHYKEQIVFDHLVFIMGIPTLVTHPHYNKWAPKACGAFY